MRPFTDLIVEIEFEGEKFIPAAKIAELCFNYNEKTVAREAQMWVNEGYDCAMWYKFKTGMAGGEHLCSMGINRSFDIRTYHKFGKEAEQNSVGWAPCNQVEIFKLLLKWGFINL